MTFTAEHELNWAGTYAYGATRILNPTSIPELQDLVAHQPKIRSLGTRHSFNPVADGPGVLVTTLGLPGEVVIADDRRSAVVSSGLRYADVATELEAAGLALHNMGSLPHISVGGATATGTHGSGVGNGSLSTAVRGIEFVGADGELRWVRRGDPEFDGSVIHLGVLGPATRLELDVQPSYRVRQDVYLGVPWEAVDGPKLREVMGLGYSVSLFMNWGDDITQMWVKSRIPDNEADIEVPDEYFGAPHHSERASFIGKEDNTTPMDGSVGPWSTRLPHFKIESTPSNGDEIQAEFFVPLDRGSEALAAVRTLAGAIRPLLLVTELRAIAADDYWLSETQGQDSLAIHFTFGKHPAEVEALLPQIEGVLEPFTSRPHWGKVSSLTPEQYRARYSRMPEFRALAEKYDPAAKFGGGFVDAILER